MMGHTIGKYEEDTLVVDTIAVDPDWQIILGAFCEGPLQVGLCQEVAAGEKGLGVGQIVGPREFLPADAFDEAPSGQKGV